MRLASVFFCLFALIAAPLWAAPGHQHAAPAAIEGLMLTINGWMQGSFGLAFAACLLWGLITVVLCPCHLVAIPLIAGYVGGQGADMRKGEAARHSIFFCLGLIATITIVAGLCALLGRMLGDISPYWAIPVGLVIIALGLNLTGAVHLHAPTRRLGALALRGTAGAFILGLLYGFLSGASTLGFMAPILAILTVQGMLLKGTLLVFAFAVGHSLPLVAAGSSVPFLQKLLQNAGVQRASLIGRVLFGSVVLGVGAYVLTTPFF